MHLAAMPLTMRRRVCRAVCAGVLAVVLVCAAAWPRACAAAGTRCESAAACYGTESNRPLLRFFRTVIVGVNGTLSDSLSEPCGREYATCTTDGVVLDLSAVDLVGGTVPILVELDYVDYADLPPISVVLDSHRNVVGTVPESWSGLSSLTGFSASGTGMSGTLPESWVSLTKMQTVRLDDTTVTGTLPAAWSSMTELRVVSLARTGVSRTLPESWASLTKMQTVQLDDTAVAGTLPAAWSSMTELQVVSLARTSVSGTLPESWVSLTKMQTVRLDDTTVTGTLPAAWSSMAELQVVSLARTTVSGTLPELWGSLTKMQTVQLDDTTVTGTLPAAWSSMTDLRVVSLAGTDVNGTLPESWGRLTRLTTLLLNGTNVSGTIPASWSSMTALRVVSLANTSVTGCVPRSWLSPGAPAVEGGGLTVEGCPGSTASGVRWWVILLVVLGAAVVVGLVAVLVVCCCRRKKEGRSDATSDGAEGEMDGDAVESLHAVETVVAKAANRRTRQAATVPAGSVSVPSTLSGCSTVETSQYSESWDSEDQESTEGSSHSSSSGVPLLEESPTVSEASSQSSNWSDRYNLQIFNIAPRRAEAEAPETRANVLPSQSSAASAESSPQRSLHHNYFSFNMRPSRYLPQDEEVPVPASPARNPLVAAEQGRLSADGPAQRGGVSGLFRSIPGGALSALRRAGVSPDSATDVAESSQRTVSNSGGVFPSSFVRESRRHKPRQRREPREARNPMGEMDKHPKAPLTQSQQKRLNKLSSSTHCNPAFGPFIVMDDTGILDSD